MRHKSVEKRITPQDPIYKSRLVTKLVNSIMNDGKKTTAQRKVYKAFELLKEKGNPEPLLLFEKAVQNTGPKVEVKARRVGGASYQVPTEVRGERKTTLALRWIIQAARAKSSREYHLFEQKLAQEILEASQNNGEAIKKRDNVHRMAEANKAFAHFRW